MKNFLNRSFVVSLILTALLTLCACAASDGAESTADPSGGKVPLPENVETIVALAPSLNETLVDLGLGDKIIGYDTESEGTDGLNPDAAKFDIVNPDLETLAAIEPDIVFTTGLSYYDADDPYKPLADAGICVVNVPTPDSLEAVKKDIVFIAEAAGVPEKGKELAADFDSQLEAIKKTAESIPESERKSVYFEISAAPEMYSTGSDTYLNEIIELIGARNILSDESGWMPVSGEAVAAADPDVILTNVNYIDDPVGEIMSRDGFSRISAVKNGEVYAVDNRSSSLPNENIVKAAKQMAWALYPEYYENI